MSHFIYINPNLNHSVFITDKNSHTMIAIHALVTTQSWNTLNREIIFDVMCEEGYLGHVLLGLMFVKLQKQPLM